MWENLNKGDDLKKLRRLCASKSRPVEFEEDVTVFWKVLAELDEEKYELVQARMKEKLMIKKQKNEKQKSKDATAAKKKAAKKKANAREEREKRKKEEAKKAKIVIQTSASSDSADSDDEVPPSLPAPPPPFMPDKNFLETFRKLNYETADALKALEQAENDADAAMSILLEQVRKRSKSGKRSKSKSDKRSKIAPLQIL